MYVETSGDATFTALIESFDSDQPWSKAGIMVREDMSPNGAHYSMFTTGSNGIANNYRSCKGCSTVHVQTSYYEADPKVWFRISKSGDVYTSYYKPAGSSYWYQFGARLSIPRIDAIGGSYMVGIAVSAHSNTTVAEVQVANAFLQRSCLAAENAMQCDQASNCESGTVTGYCYKLGERPVWESSPSTASIFDSNSNIATFGCDQEYGSYANNLVDRTTYNFVCNKKDPADYDKRYCGTGNRADYRGTLAVTESGKTCQRWDSQSPHSHSRTAARYPYSALEENFWCAYKGH